MCFKCKAVSHPGVTCNNVGNAELRAYIKNNNVLLCPSCGHGTEKIDGCNHMTCSNCFYEWCWICRGSYNYLHYSKLNIFGCAGAHFTEIGKCGDFWFKFLQLLSIPFIVILGPIIFGISIHIIILIRCKNSTRYFFMRNLFFNLLLFPITLGLGCLLSALGTTFLLAPAILL
jgi:hypothetical protein